jgi:phosphomannomutase/phosphoglucomutase
MTKTGKKLSALIEELPEYFIEKGKINCKEELKDKILKALIKDLEGSKINTIDGAKIWLDNKGSILIRPSGTEPVYRLYAEAKSAQKAKNLINEYMQRLQRIIADLTR